ncbi:MAG: hypothetical protein A2Y15_00525 [Clostridiales bacterium GWF2_36_10]|nr:MAG: hypothetical protein A2Y15_00525 [Clostridiales bacterium GWF2_36_10]HAN21724.1 hypothetical protein [Clostridiales bacterium]
MFNEMCDYNFAEHLSEYIGETVTIYATCGGLSGVGFTGVVLSVNNCFVRLITKFGPVPECTLGSACIPTKRRGCCGGGGLVGGLGGGFGNGFGGHGDGGFGFNSIGCVSDIPIDRIACFVHNAV